jgi:adenylyl cyclase-associated protein
MTHKNPELRASSVVKAKDEAPAPKPIASGKTVSKAPPKFALEGNRWCVENQDNQRELVITDIDPKNIVYIGNCVNCTIQVKGKANAVVFDGCKKTAVVVESLVSSFDVINCKSVQCQITGTAPTCAIDKTDGCILYLSKECLGIEIFTSKSSELNVSIPGKNPNDDYIELPVAEQFKTVVKDNALVTGVVEHKG